MATKKIPDENGDKNKRIDVAIPAIGKTVVKITLSLIGVKEIYVWVKRPSPALNIPKSNLLTRVMSNE